MKRKLICLVTSALIALPAIAQDYGERVENARRTMMEAAMDVTGFDGHRSEALCHIVSTELDVTHCAVFNSSFQYVGQELVWSDRMEHGSRTFLLENCSNGTMLGNHKPECIVFMDIESEEGLLFALTAAPVSQSQ